MKHTHDTTQTPKPAYDPEYARLVRRGIEIWFNRPIMCLQVDENLFDDTFTQDAAGQFELFQIMK